MGKVVYINLPQDAKLTGTVNIVDATLIAFNYDKEFSNYYWVFETDDNENYLIRISYLIAKEDPERTIEMSYYNHPLFAILNICNMNNERSGLARKIVSNFNATNSFYSDFALVDTVTDCAIINLIQKDINGNIKYKKAILPFHIYMKIAVNKFNICFKFLFDPTFAGDSSYEKFILHENCKLSYLGSEPTDDKYQFHNFYSLSYGDNKIGVACPYHTSTLINILSKVYKESSFNLFYSNNMVVDPTLMVPLFWKNPVEFDSKTKLYIAIIRKRTKEIFLITQEEYLMIVDPIDLLSGGNNNE